VTLQGGVVYKRPPWQPVCAACFDTGGNP
jgi:hypothetical protein